MDPLTSRRGATLLLGLAGLALLLALTPGAAAGPTVQALAVSFSPESVNVNEGDFVRWVDASADGQGHTVTAAGLFDYDLPNGATKDHTFVAVATVSYVCNIHPGMDGTVTVVNVAPSVGISTGPASGASVQGEFTIGGTAADPGGVTAVEVSLDNGGTWVAAALDNGAWSFVVDATGRAHGSTITARARVTDGEGNTAQSGSRSYTVNAPPAPAFTFAPAAPTSADTVQFTSTTTDDHAISTHTWAFGDGATSPATNATHRFAKGSYTVRLTVTDDHGVELNTTRALTVLNSAPKANFTLNPADPAINEAVAFTDRTDDLDGDATTWAWDFGDGATSTQRNATHTYTTPGTYTVKLNVTDAEGAANLFQKVIEVSEFATQRPVATMVANPARVVAGKESVTFTLGGSDPDGTVVNWTFDPGDGSPKVQGPGSLFANGATHAQAHLYQKNGTFEAVLTLRDNIGALGTNRTLVQVDPPPNRPPQVRFEVAPTTQPRKGQTVVFADKSTDLDFDDRVVSWEWTFGDGARDCCDKPQVSHAYAKAGRFEARLTVADTLGEKATVPIAIDVHGEAPRVSLSVNATQGRAPYPVTFNITARDNDGRIERWSLDFGDGSPPHRAEGAPGNATVQHVYENAGAFGAQLTAEDDDALTGSSVVTINVAARLPAAQTLPPDAISVAPTGQRFTFTFAATAAMPGISEVQWAFGDGRTASGRQVQYSYEQAGTYTVTLTLLNDNGPVARATRSVGVGEDAGGVAARLRAEVASGVIRLVWTPDSRAAGYQVWKATAGGGFELLDEVRNTDQYSDQEVQDGQAYTYQVTFFSADGSGRLTRLSQLGATEAFRRLGQVATEGLIDADGDGVGDTADAFPQDSTRSVAPASPLLPALGLVVLLGAGIAAWKYQDPLKARLGLGPEPGALVTIPGLQPQHAFILQKAGVANVRGLAIADPADLARRTVLPRHVLDHWVAVAQLLQLPGIPPREADQLARAGIRGPWDLARADPSALTPRLQEVPLAKVQRWVRTARRATSAS